ncbi:MAG: restriction endonuclease [Alphaproteobacteria bacterium]|jgi:hypothetical protein|nr:restriction endonuclease [Alphaproteobacteria bacterium]QQS57751.1 MAG: restriction endonuclease [Alphaproteobacteria bacterium]
MKQSEFEKLLDQIAESLTSQAQKGTFATSKIFEDRVREVLTEFMVVDLTPHPHAFPDIVLGDYGIEVKFTTNDTWRSVANSVFENTRSKSVEHIYVVFGKMGGTPEVRWGRYDDCVMHVRTSHVPRFEVEIGAETSLFQKMGLSYEVFRNLSEEDKMLHIRLYARRRLKKGERLWWLEDKEDSQHSLPLQAKLYTSLEQEEKRRLRAESVLLCPQVLKSSRSKNKYDDAVLYMLTYRGILCHQARDLFSAGSVALRASSERGGVYLLRALQDIEHEILIAASTLEDRLFEEYWGKKVQKEHRIGEWLKMADGHASGWKPSEYLFKDYKFQ